MTVDIHQRSRKAQAKTLILDLMVRAGVFGAVQRRHRSVLTVLNYHRIDDTSRAGFDSFAPNVTATPDAFARQMDYVQRHFNVITCAAIASWLRGESELPAYPALITFDDGYRDNYVNAFPILKERNLSAIIFLTTGLIETNEPAYWDYTAYCFHHTRKTSTTLPYVGPVSWVDERERRNVMKSWIESLKRLPDPEKHSAVQGLPDLLEVSVDSAAFSDLYLTWDEVREMSRNGIEIGSHTVGHPILTRVPLKHVEHELVTSRHKIESEIEQQVIAFAYPNGGVADYSNDVIQVVLQAGYQLAFTLTGDFAQYQQVRSNPLAISRIYLDRTDTFSRFVAKIS